MPIYDSKAIYSEEWKEKCNEYIAQNWELVPVPEQNPDNVKVVYLRRLWKGE